ncbi:MAG: NAD-dependent deacetylase, partial [Thermodesulfobacteriota bacterium]
LAGSRDVLELHGSIWRLRCVGCGREAENRVTGLSKVPLCACGGMLRPGVVWFGESLPADVFNRSYALAAEADFVLVVGTSGVVQPAASLVSVAKDGGAFIVEVNPEETPLKGLADVTFHEAAGEIVPRLLK